MIVELAKAKINLALHVLGRRVDGYHMLDSIVGFADVGDRMTFVEAVETSLKISGPFGPMLAADEGNIVSKAVSALAAQCGGRLPGGAAITLEKNLPVASGMGGGSADAAATLRGLMRLWKLKIADHELKRLALKLGADVPVCLLQSYCRMRGVGEEIELLGDAPWKAIVLVNPRMSQLTQDVFKELNLDLGQRYRSGVEVDKADRWRNDLQKSATNILPVIEKVCAVLKQHGPDNEVRMSGSGATCFAACEKLDAAESLAASISHAHPSWWVSAGRLS